MMAEESEEELWRTKGGQRGGEGICVVEWSGIPVVVASDDEVKVCHHRFCYP